MSFGTGNDRESSALACHVNPEDSSRRQSLKTLQDTMKIPSAPMRMPKWRADQLHRLQTLSAMKVRQSVKIHEITDARSPQALSHSTRK
jgi:hypothetical protein